MKRSGLREGEHSREPLNQSASWRWVPLRDICAQDRCAVSPNESRAKERPYLSLEHIESKTGRIFHDASIPLEDGGNSTTFLFDSRHVLYGKLRPYLNKVALPDFSGRCTTELIPLLPCSELTREFLALLLRRDVTVATAMRDKTGSRMPRADLSTLMEMEVPLPPLPLQRRIAAQLKEQLAEVDRARTALQAQVAAAKALPSAFLRAVFGDGDEQDTHAEWNWIRLRDLTETCSGTTPPRGNPDFYGGAIPWVKTGELRDTIITTTEEHVTELALSKSSLRLLPAGTLLIAMYGQGQTRGRTGLLGCPATTNQACFAILPDPSYDPDFMQFWFRNSYQRLRLQTEGRGGNQPNLNGELLNEERVPLPPLSIQRSLAAHLRAEIDSATELRTILEARLATLEQFPAALLRQVFGQTPQAAENLHS
jgi:type I restriction enzyme S subunit